jgi:hypothetical protein
MVGGGVLDLRVIDQEHKFDRKPKDRDGWDNPSREYWGSSTGNG